MELSPRKPCQCGGALELRVGKEGGFLNTFVITRDRHIVGCSLREEVRPSGGAWMCNRCEHCERA